MAKTKKVQMPLGIRKKMTAAISMLLIACIMLVSSTYAWFVLSTAPEVTGITTQVGANGNLEIALLNDETYKDLNLIQTNEGDSMDVENKDVKQANVTWGNLVDLKDGAYGLGSILLTPAELNLSDNKSLGSILLRTPNYGSDGRVSNVTANTVTGTYVNNVFTYNEDAYGVRAIGTASSLTVRQTSYRSAVSSISSFAEQAKSKANASLSTYGSDLATVMVALVQGTTSFDIKYKANFQGMVDTISEANTAVGNGIKQASLAYALSKGGRENTLTDDQVTAIVTAVGSAAVTEDALKTATGLSSLPASIVSAIATYKDTADRVADSQAALSGIAADATSLTDSQIKDIVDGLVVRDNMTICGVSASLDQTTIMNAVIDSYTDGKGLVIEMATGSGVYSNISDSCGNYTSQVSAVVTYKDILNNKEVTAYMKTKSLMVDGSQTSNYYLTVALSDIQTSGEPESTATAGASPITDTFGYALDFAFRTNAAGSKLLLQTAERQRVYSDSEASGTQGAGSYMEFNATDKFDATEVATLMGAIRVAFVQPTSSGHELLAVGKLDTTGADTSGTTVKAGLYLYEYTYDIPAGASADMGVLTVSDTKVASAAITELTQNTPESITVIVYIDGNIVDNAMVENAVMSMTGVLNLQFASDANLKPMENSELRQVVAKDITYTQITQATADDLAAAATALNVTSIDSIYEGSDGNYYYSTDGTNRIMVPTTYKNAIDNLVNGSGS